MTNATAKKFGYPETCIKEFDTWIVLLRPQQVTLGSLVLVCNEDATAFSDLTLTAFQELHPVIAQIENSLSRAFDYDKINYLMLMMVDPDVHFHVLPRYGHDRDFQGQTFRDHGWPGPPDLKQVTPTGDTLNQQLITHISDSWQ